MEKINEFFHVLEIRTLSAVREKEKRQNLLQILAIALAGILIVVSVISYFIFKQSITSPLTGMLQLVREMENGKYKFEVEPGQKDEIGTLLKAFVFMAGKVYEHIQVLEEMTRTDSLTKIRNRISLDEALVQEKYKFERYQTECSIIMLDIDHFKQVNDKFGHLVGDRVLMDIAEILSTHIRKSDIAGRWGGEEFLVICPNTSLKQCRVLAESIRKRIEEHDFAIVGNVTASLGVSTFRKNLSVEKIVDQADKALYKAKDSGRNRVS